MTTELALARGRDIITRAEDERLARKAAALAHDAIIGALIANIVAPDAMRSLTAVMTAKHGRATL